MNSSVYSFAFLLLFAWPFSSHDTQTSAWEFAKLESGVKVYTRTVEGSTCKEFKAETSIPGQLADFVAVMQSVDTYKDWMPDTESSRMIVRKNETNLFYYIETDAPWPVSNRDATYSMVMKYRPNEKAVYCTIKALSGILPEVPGVVRMTHANGYWKFREMGNGRVEVTLQIHAEPGGNIPGWLANTSVTSTPIETLLSLTKEVKNPRYHNQKFEFLTLAQ